MKCSLCGKDNVEMARECTRCGTDLQFIRIEKGQYYVPGFSRPVDKKDDADAAPYARFGRRAFAAVMDLFLLTIVLRTADLAGGDFVWAPWKWKDAPPQSLVWMFLLGGTFYLLNFVLAEASFLQASAGKALLGLRVTDEYGEKISIGRSILRSAARLLSVALALYGFVMAALTPKKQALHDLVAGTFVLYPPPVRETPPEDAWEN